MGQMTKEEKDMRLCWVLKSEIGTERGGTGQALLCLSRICLGGSGDTEGTL